MPKRAVPPPPIYDDLDDFLWRDFESPAAWNQWLGERGATAVRGSAFASAMRLQTALRQFEDVNNGAALTEAPAAVINRLIADYHIRPAVRSDADYRLTATGGYVGRMLVVVLEAMAAGTWKRFKRCRDDSCRASFFDQSKSGTRAWCSMDRCGARAKMRRLRGT